MVAPQIIMIFCLVANLLITAVLHGKSKGNYDFWVTFIGTVLEIGILYWGGFFRV